MIRAICHFNSGLVEVSAAVTSISGAWKESSLHSVDALAADKGDSWAYYAFESLVEVLMLCKRWIKSGENQTSQHNNIYIYIYIYIYVNKKYIYIYKYLAHARRSFTLRPGKSRLNSAAGQPAKSGPIVPQKSEQSMSAH